MSIEDVVLYIELKERIEVWKEERRVEVRRVKEEKLVGVMEGEGEGEKMDIIE